MKRPVALLLVLIVMFTASCTDRHESATGESAEAESTDVRSEGVATFLVALEQTDDVAAWNERYEANTATRTERGMSEVLTAEDLDRPGTVMTIQSVADAKEALGFFATHAAVQRPKKAFIVTMTELGPQPDRPTGLIVLRGRVDDRTAWTSALEEGAEARAAAGLHLAGTGWQTGDNSMLFQAWFATDLDAARAWVAGSPGELPGASGDADVSVRFVEPIN